MDNFVQQSLNDIDVATVAIDFSSLYSVSQRNYEGNNIPDIITQLLNMYQPKDGIIAYERVLRKVQGLLKDCDSRKKRLFLSMVPVPKNAPDHTIKEVFRTTTGFAKLNPPENDASRNTSDVRNTDGITDNSTLSSKQQSFSCNKNTLDSKSSSSLSEGFPFRGFAESEISTTVRGHVKNVNRLNSIKEHDCPRLETPIDLGSKSASRINRQADHSSSYQSNNNPKNWSDRNDTCQMSTYRQYLLNKRYYAPARVSGANESHLCYSSQTVYQDTKTSDKSEIKEDLYQDKVPRKFNDVRYEPKKCDGADIIDKDTKLDVSQTTIDIGQNATIKDDICKMDVCWDEDQNIFIDADDLLATVRDGLRTSLSNFLKRAQEGTFLEVSAFPRIRSYPQVSSSIYLASKDRKPATARKASEKDYTSGFASSDSKSCIFLQRQNTDINARKNHGATDEKTKQKASVCANDSQTKRNSQECDKKAAELSFQNDSDYTMEKKAITFQFKENDMVESMHGCKMPGLRSNDVNSENNFQVHSMSELAAYKKQYYDTLLSVQRAKVAVTNSLASSSDHLMAYDDPYYSNYACHRQHLFQQQRQYTMGPQFSTCSTALSGLPGTYGNQYSWARSDCKYLLLKQLRLRRQTSPVYARDQGWIHRYVGPTYPCPFMPNGSDQAKQCVRRKSLEDIVGKLKGTQ